MERLGELLPAGFTTAILWVGGLLVLFALLLLFVRLVREYTSGTFVSGGRARKARLAVMDAAPVDSRRRLVLVRRDDVEHLILIGGPTDVVVEQNIGVAGRTARAPGPEHAEAQRLPAEPARPGVPTHDRPAPPARPVQPPVRQPVPAALERPAAAMPRPQAGAPPARQAQAMPPRPAPTAALPRADDLDARLLGELEASLGTAPAQPAAPPTIEDEMNRLLGELSGKRN